MARHIKAAFGWYVLLLYPHSTYVSSLGHISTTIPPMDLQPLSLASSVAAACNTVAIMASLHHGETYKGCFWLVCTIVVPTFNVCIFFRSYLNNYTTYGPPTTFIGFLCCSRMQYCSDNGVIAPWRDI